MTTPCCPRCGTQLPATSPEGLCPKCLLQAGLQSEFDSPGTAETAPSPQAGRGFVPPTVEQLSGRFPQLEILELIGHGGMGAVYKARQRELDRLVALKILPPEVSSDPAFAERFSREARALAKLSHANIVGVYDSGKATGPLPRGEGRDASASLGEGDVLYYLTMEYIDGVNLRQAMQAGSISPEEAVAIVPQICDALQYAHDEGIVHRDIKPENVLVDAKGRVKIADFGLAKLLQHEPTDFTLTQAQQVMGTPRYMAPEQMAASANVDHRADIYSLGVVFYELLTGEVPMGRFDPPSKRVQVDVRLDEIVLRTLDREPDRRYQRASEVKTDVESVALKPSIASARDRTVTSADSTEAVDHIRTRVREPAIGLMIAGAVNVLATIGMGAWFAAILGEEWTRFVMFGVVLLVLNLLIARLWIVAGLRLRKLERYSTIVLAAAVCLLPLWPGWLVSMPIGLWVLLIIWPEEVRSAFQVKEAQIRGERSRSNDMPRGPHASSSHELAWRTDATDQAQQEVKVPAIGLMVAGIVTCLFAVLPLLVGAGLFSRWASQRDAMPPELHQSAPELDVPMEQYPELPPSEPEDESPDSSETNDAEPRADALSGMNAGSNPKSDS